MSTASSTTSHTHMLEARALLEASSFYDEEDIDEILTVYASALKHIGWEDTRSDRRFVVKFHDIYYHTPDTFVNTPEFNSLFEDFCDQTREDVQCIPELDTTLLDELLTERYVGNYQAFVLDIPRITADNALDIAKKVYDEYMCNCPADHFKAHIAVVDALKHLEDTYLTQWIDFLEANGYQDIAEQTKQHIKERKK